MAEELTQPGFDDAIEKLKNEVMTSGERTDAAIEDQTVAFERTIGKSVKAMLRGLANATGLVKQISVSQQTIQKQQEVEQKQEKKNIFLLTNIRQTLTGLLTLGLGAKLSETERKREEKRTSDALMGALTELGSGFKGLQKGLGKALKLAINPLALIGSIVGIAIGTVAGLSVLISKTLKLPGLLKSLFAPFKLLLSPKSQIGKALLKVVTFMVKTVGSIVKVFARVSRFIARMLPFVDDILRFIKPFVRIGLKLSRLVGRIFVPLTVAISIFKAIFGFVDELKKGGDVLDASLRAIGDVFAFLSFGLLNADQLKKFIGEPIREFIDGIKELFTEGFSAQTLKKIFEPFVKFLLATPNILIQSVGKLTAFIAEKLGFENFAEKLTAFLAEFDLFTFIKDAIQSVVAFFASIPEKITRIPEILGSIKDSIINTVKAVFNQFIDDPIGTVKEIGSTIVDMFTKLTDTLFGFIIDTLPDFLLPKELEDVKAARKRERAEAAQMLLATAAEVGSQIRQLQTQTPSLQAGGILAGQTLARIAESEPEAVIPLSRLGDLIVNPAIASALQLANQMAINANLRDRAAAPTVIAPVTAPTVISGGNNVPIPIIAPLSLRNNENTLRQIMQQDFRGSMP